MRFYFEIRSAILFSTLYLYSSILVHIDIGNKTFSIKGRTLKIFDNTIYHFSKIPYAKPPVGNRRFLYPEELDVPPWNGIYDSDVECPTCWQGTPASDFDLHNPAGKMWFSKTKMSEDCLYLSIWTPEINVLSKPLPVMIWIYGGSYMSGSNTLEVYNGSILASKQNVVIVTFQFRIGPLGFLYMDDVESPGNQALMDQRMVLKWVKKHIRKFGGNPELVTVFGESSGATSISVHLFSPQTNNLFKRAILQSGTILAPWAIESSSSALTKGKYLAKVSNCSRSRSRETIKCLRAISAEDIVTYNFDIRNQIAESRKQKLLAEGYTGFYSDAAMFFDIYFRPIVDQNMISKKEIQSINEGRFPNNKEILIGTNANEAMFFLLYGLSNFNFLNSSKVIIPSKMNYPSLDNVDPFKIVLENILDLDYLYPSLAKLILYEYNIPSSWFNDKEWTAKDLLEKLDRIGGDTQFICPTVQFADSVSKADFAKLFMYHFNSRTLRTTVPEWMGVMHGYEIEYVFGMPFSPDFSEKYYSFTEEEKEISEAVMKMWTNFAKYGNPTLHDTKYKVIWPPYSNRNKQYLKISNSQNGGFTVENNFRDKICKFWTKILPGLKNSLLKKSKGCSGLWGNGLLTWRIVQIVASLVALHLTIFD